MFSFSYLLKINFLNLSIFSIVIENPPAILWPPPLIRIFSWDAEIIAEPISKPTTDLADGSQDITFIISFDKSLEDSFDLRVEMTSTYDEALGIEHEIPVPTEEYQEVKEENIYGIEVKSLSDGEYSDIC